MLELATGWQISIDESAEWLFIRVESLGSDNIRPTLCDSLWSFADNRRINRLVCELADTVWMKSYLIGQLVMLHKRATLQGGTMRLCGLPDDKHDVLCVMGLGERFPNYTTREDAVMGYRPRKPR